VFVGVHSASLAAELISSVPRETPRTVLLLNSVDPSAIRAIEDNVDLTRTLFVVASKQGSSLRMSLLLLHFLRRFKEAGMPFPGSHFIAFTESNSYVAELAKQYVFREIFVDPPGILTQFSGLIHYNVILAALGTQRPAELAASAQEMKNACSPDTLPSANPALALAALLAAVHSQSGRLLICPSSSLAPLADRLSFIIGSATCRRGRGIFSTRIRGLSPHQESAGDLSVTLGLTGSSLADLDAYAARRREAGSPMLQIRIEDVSQIAAEVFCWEIASSLAASRIGVNPFDESDLAALRSLVHSDLDISGSIRPPTPTQRFSDSSCELYFEGVTRRELSALSLEAALESLLRLVPANGYLALLAFLPHSKAIKRQLKAVHTDLQSILQMSVILTFDSRFLNRMGQTLLDGPNIGAVLLLTADPASDLQVFGAPYTFGRLKSAFASATFTSLSERQRHVVRVHFRRDAAESLNSFSAALRQAAENVAAKAVRAHSASD
jgi:transaldolase / glucose-6-phosphate isomerase